MGSARPDRDQQFAQQLDTVAKSTDGPRALALLRRGIAGPSAALEVYRVLDRVIPYGTSDWDIPAYETVAALYAVYHQGRTGSDAIDGGLGSSFAHLARLPDWDADRAARRLTVVLTASPEALPERLRGAITLLRGAGVPIDWARLAHDVRYWGHPDRWVQRSWGREFVRAQAAPTEGAATAAVMAEGGAA